MTARTSRSSKSIAFIRCSWRSYSRYTSATVCSKYDPTFWPYASASSSTFFAAEIWEPIAAGVNRFGVDPELIETAA